jgi:hypothetical protein
MNLFGLLWVVSSIGSFFSLHSPLKASDYLTKILSVRAFALVGAIEPSSAASQVHSVQLEDLTRSVPATPPALTLAMKENIYHTAQLNRSLLLPSDLWNPLRDAMLQPGSANQFATSPAQPQSVVMSSLRPDLASLVESELGFSNRIVQLVESLSRLSKRIGAAFKTSMPLVTVTQVQHPRLSPESSSLLSFTVEGDRDKNEQAGKPDQDQFGSCAAEAVVLPTSPAEAMFQVQVKGQVIAELPSQIQADRLARRFRQVLKMPDFNPYQLHPAIVDAMPAGKVGDQTLFWIDSELASWFDRSPEVIAITWVNHLRSAFGVPPLALVDAQSQLHRLVSTPKRLTGVASWYGPDFHGRLTATGETFRQTELTAAHPSLPFGTYLKVTNLETGDKVIVRINDRGPYFENRSLDLSREAARCLHSERSGVIPYDAVIMQGISSDTYSLNIN